MGDHLALLVNRLLTESTLQAAIESRNRDKQMEEEREFELLKPNKVIIQPGELSSLVECRICQDEDFDSNMETPCSCCGSLKYAHRRCVQRWCDEKGDTMCEICHQPFKPGYREPPPTVLGYRQIRRNWQINRRNNSSSESRLLETVPSSVDDTNTTDCDDDHPYYYSLRNLIFRIMVATIFLTLLILRHTLPIMVNKAEQNVLPLFVLAAMRISGILLVVYVTMMAVIGIRRSRNREEIRSHESDTFNEETHQHPPHSHIIQIS